jgi:putative intracellular protease/amidase
MKPWHYINIEKDGEYVPGNGDNIIDRFNITYRELQHKKTLNNETIKTDLLLIFHLVGKQLTSYKTIKTDLVNAGAYWKDGEVLVDNGLITSRSPKDIPAFCKKMIEEIEEEIHA